ncbi:2Fe-2S iron-sulfur cluster-binding protein [Acuticoccus mangrovi]|uniref:Succinate dehydrogenase iron-sulfur subunit n=1 Tax=Acuticoccus mangrovi TaxID=2796142 RepID=A0A934ME11_9HYPH|nr:2Fe-2S iron-sulfur cluster-binding protein [Acuticoccus mangrovi]MBJ3776982.1 hypothetical protein [Acuticoccus mangrovi]
MSATAKLSVKRGTPEHTYDEEFDIPYSEGMSILDALMWIHAHADSTLAVRYSCINANACKECSVMVNGKVTYACTARLSREGDRVEPLPTKTLVRDLVTDTLPAKETLASVLAGSR